MRCPTASRVPARGAFRGGRRCSPCPRRPPPWPHWPGCRTWTRPPWSTRSTARPAAPRRSPRSAWGSPCRSSSEGVSFTWVATDLEAADARRGPVPRRRAVRGVARGRAGRHRLRRRAARRAAVAHLRRRDARAGVSSTLSIPLMTGAEVYGGVNLYGGTPDAFDGLPRAAGRPVRRLGRGSRHQRRPVLLDDGPGPVGAAGHRGRRQLQQQAVGMIMAAHERGPSPPHARRLMTRRHAPGSPWPRWPTVLSATHLL